MKKSTMIKRAILAGALLLGAVPAMAAPALQLYINGATYNNKSETWVTNSPLFELGAYLDTANGNADLPGDVFYISAALIPSSSSTGKIGTFVFAGSTVSATSGMVYGSPSNETPGSTLPSHGIFPAMYYQSASFNFTDAARFDSVDMDNTFSGSLVPNDTRGAMYQKLFAIDMRGLDPGMTLHFDLYTFNTRFNGPQKKLVAHSSINNAPFSHDAEATPNTPVPEPGTMMLLGSGLIGMIGYGRKKFRR